MIRLKMLITAGVLCTSLLSVAQGVKAQAQIYVNPYGNTLPYSPYDAYSGYYDPYAGYGIGMGSVPYAAYPYDSRHHYGQHRRLHWNGDEGLHWGRHWGRHHIGGHDFRFPLWF